MSAYFPLFLDLKDQTVLLLGNGVKALEKVERLQFCRPRILLAAPGLCEGLRSLLQEHQFEYLQAELTEDYVKDLILKTNPRLVIVADVEDDLIAPVYGFCREQHIEINTVDRQEHCTFIFPAIINKGKLTVAVSSSGASPAAAKRIRQEIESVLPSEVDEILDWLASLRPMIKADPALEKRHHAALYRALVDRSFAINRPLTEAETEEILSGYRK